MIQRFYCLEGDEIVWIDDSEYNSDDFEVIDRPPMMGNQLRYWGRNCYRRVQRDIEDGSLAGHSPIKSVMGSGLWAIGGEGLNAASVITSLLDALKILQSVKEYLSLEHVALGLGRFDAAISIGLAIAAVKQIIEAYKTSDTPQVKAGWLNLGAALASLASSLFSIYSYSSISTLLGIASLTFWASAEIIQSAVAQRGGTHGGGILKALGAVTLALQKLSGMGSAPQLALSLAGGSGSGAAMAGSLWAGYTHTTDMMEGRRNEARQQLLEPRRGYGSTLGNIVELDEFEHSGSLSDQDSEFSGDQVIIDIERLSHHQSSSDSGGLFMDGQSSIELDEVSHHQNSSYGSGQLAGRDHNEDIGYEAEDELEYSDFEAVS